MGCTGMGAGHEGVQLLDTVDKALFDKKRQGAIGDRRLGTEPFCIQTRKHVIGPHRGVAFEQYLQHAPPHGRQLHAALGAGGVRFRQSGADARAMVMACETQCVVRHGCPL